MPAVWRDPEDREHDVRADHVPGGIRPRRAGCYDLRPPARRRDDAHRRTSGLPVRERGWCRGDTGHRQLGSHPLRRHRHRDHPGPARRGSSGHRPALAGPRHSLRCRAGVWRSGGPGGSLCVPRPGQLLRAQARTARFRSRAAELERLTAWCAGAGVRTHLVSGPAGVGKTRLALELADRLAATGTVGCRVPGTQRSPSGERAAAAARGRGRRRNPSGARGRDHAGANAGPVAAPIRVLLLARTPRRLAGQAAVRGEHQ